MLSSSQWTASNLTVACNGVSGPVGNPGQSPSGPIGPSGPSGSSGSGGPQGNRGSSGGTGAAGPSGPAGSSFFGLSTISLQTDITTYTLNDTSPYNILIITDSGVESPTLVMSLRTREWNSSTSYVVGDVVTYNGVYYSARSRNTGSQPNLSISWTPCLWSQSFNYNNQSGIKILYNGKWYVLFIEYGHVGNVPPPEDTRGIWSLEPTSYTNPPPMTWMMLKNCSENDVKLVLSPTQTYTLTAPTDTSSPVWYVYTTGTSLYLY